MLPIRERIFRRRRSVTSRCPGRIMGRRAAPYPQCCMIDYETWGGSSNYHSLQAKVEKRFSNGFSFVGLYTWPKCLDAPGSEEGGSPVYDLDNLY